MYLTSPFSEKQQNIEEKMKKQLINRIGVEKNEKIW